MDADRRRIVKRDDPQLESFKSFRVAISAYDTEAVYAWWDAPTGPGYRGRISYEGERLAECIAGVRAVAQVHLERQAPASFFIVAELLQCAASEFRAIPDEPLFDIQ